MFITCISDVCEMSIGFIWDVCERYIKCIWPEATCISLSLWASSVFGFATSPRGFAPRWEHCKYMKVALDHFWVTLGLGSLWGHFGVTLGIWCVYVRLGCFKLAKIHICLWFFNDFIKPHFRCISHVYQMYVKCLSDLFEMYVRGISNVYNLRLPV